MLAILRFGRFL